MGKVFKQKVKVTPGSSDFTNELQIFKEEILWILYKLFHKFEEESIYHHLLYEVCITLNQNPDRSIKLQIKIPHEHTYKYSEQNFIKLNPTIYKK